jgi:hypothetical protein
VSDTAKGVLIIAAFALGALLLANWLSNVGVKDYGDDDAVVVIYRP